MLQLQRPDTLVERVVNAIRKEIDAGRLTAESRLPTEQQLTEQLNVSRSVVREAVAQLKADGILVSRRGLGSFISQNPNGSVFRFPSQKGRKPDLVQMFEMRLWIETQAASIAAQRRDDADLQRMRSALQEMHDQRSDLAAAALADVEWSSTEPSPTPARTTTSSPSMIFSVASWPKHGAPPGKTRRPIRSAVPPMPAANTRRCTKPSPPVTGSRPPPAPKRTCEPRPNV
ncbi:DNA-binding transcriptional regulator YhcF (GntR family) [Pseudomonas chlororaphis]